MDMYINGYGNKKVKLYTIEGTDELLELEFFHDRKKYYGVIDSNGRLLVPISEIPILESFATNDRTNYCFTKQDKYTGFYESFHLLKEKDNQFYLRADISGDEYTNCRLVPTIKDDYWFIESTANGIMEFNLYDARNAQILTPGFTEISFEKEKSRVLAYVEKDLYANIDNENIYLTSLCSYIDYAGNFISDIYDTKSDLIYDARSYNFDKKFKRFNTFVSMLLDDHIKKYNDKQRNVTEVLCDMFNHLYSADDLKLGKPAKILEYRRNCSNDEKRSR